MIYYTNCQRLAYSKCSKDVVRFADLANYHRSFVKNFSELGAAPLYQVLDNHKFQCGSEQEQEQAPQGLKSALVSLSVLALPYRTRT